MAKMLRHKETGELFIYTSLLAKNDILELVPEDPVKEVIAEVVAEQASAPVEPAVVAAEQTLATEAVASTIDEVLATFDAPAAKPTSKKKAV